MEETQDPLFVASLPINRVLHALANIGLNGVSDGAWTRDIPDHNRVLYQLSYAHHDVTNGVYPETNDNIGL